MKNLIITNNESGRSMIEMLGVLAIIGVLSVGGIAGYSKAMQKYRINKTIEQVTLIAGNIRSFYAPQRTYDGIDCYSMGGQPSYSIGDSLKVGCSAIKKAKLVPDEMYDGSKIMDTFGHYINIGPATKSVSGDKLAFSISLNWMPESECIDLLSQDWSATSAKGALVHTAMGPGASSSYYKLPMDINQAISACESIGKSLSQYNITGAKVNLIFYFDIDVNGTYWKNQLRN